MCQPGPHCSLFPLKGSYRALGTGIADCSQHSLLKPLAFPALWTVLQRRLGPDSRVSCPSGSNDADKVLSCL